MDRAIREGDYARMPVTDQDRAEIWQQIAKIRLKQHADSVGFMQAMYNSRAIKEGLRR